MNALIFLLFFVASVYAIENTRRGSSLKQQVGRHIPIPKHVGNLPIISTRRTRKYLTASESALNALEGWTPPPTGDYVYVPPEVGPEIYAGSIIAVLPIIWATVEFTSRIRTQRNCLACNGSGLVYVTKQGTPLTRPRKCWSCGGFIPWLGWKMFFLSTFFDVGNGGVLQRPSKDYEENNERIRRERERAGEISEIEQ